jgi:double zinc ribbon protein
VAEALAAAVVGVVVLWLVLQPVIRPTAQRDRALEPLDPEETPKGIALTALKEIEFDRETGKLSDSDYNLLKRKYTDAALEALRQESGESAFDNVEAMIAAKLRGLRSASDTPLSNTAGPHDPGPTCSACGPRPELDALFCSSCGLRLPSSSTCDRCTAALSPDSRFCEACGRQVAA